MTKDIGEGSVRCLDCWRVNEVTLKLQVSDLQVVVADSEKHDEEASNECERCEGMRAKVGELEGKCVPM